MFRLLSRSEQAPEKFPEQSRFWQVPEEVAEQVPEEVVELALEEVLEQVLEDQVPDEVPKQVPDKGFGGRFWGKVPEKNKARRKEQGAMAQPRPRGSRSLKVARQTLIHEFC